MRSLEAHVKGRRKKRKRNIKTNQVRKMEEMQKIIGSAKWKMQKMIDYLRREKFR
jgi:hypothetical protein